MEQSLEDDHLVLSYTLSNGTDTINALLSYNIILSAKPG